MQSVESIIETTMARLKTIVDVNTIVGEPIPAGNGVVVPVSKVSFGFFSGGGEYAPPGKVAGAALAEQKIGYGLNFFVAEQDKHDFHHKYRDICSSFILHIGMEMEVLNRSTVLFILGYDNFFSNMMSSSNDYKVTMSNLCFEIGFLF